MASKAEQRKMEKIFLDIFNAKKSTKKAAIDDALSHFSLTKEELRDSSTNGKKNVLKSKLGAVFARLSENEILIADDEGVYSLSKTRPAIIHEEKCEHIILTALKEGCQNKDALRALLIEHFGTDRTASRQDDAKLSTALSAVLTRLTRHGVISREGDRYALCEKCLAEPKNLVEISRLRSEYLARVHEMGGEFFEHYFMNLLERYSILYQKTILENTISGGSEDGGIDGILRTKDSLGFEETIMVQTKNRRITFTEKDMRGFYGAVHAKMGSRGIFATTGSFHSGAIRFIDSLPDLVAVDGYKLFEMAVKTHYGIKKSGGKLTVDTALIG